MCVMLQLGQGKMCTLELYILFNLQLNQLREIMVCITPMAHSQSVGEKRRRLRISTEIDNLRNCPCYLGTGPMDVSYLLLGTKIIDPIALCPMWWMGQGLALRFILPSCSCSFPSVTCFPSQSLRNLSCLVNLKQWPCCPAPALSNNG